MSIWYFLSVWLHVILAAFWIGGMLFLPLVILPGIRNHPDRIRILYDTGIRFRFFGWIVLAGLLVTGLLNARLRGFTLNADFFSVSNYGRLVAWKIGIFTLILLLSGAHDWMFGKKALEEMQEAADQRLRLMARWSGRINLLLGCMMAFLGLLLSRGGQLPG